MHKNILLAATKSITINIFLDKFIISSYQKKNNISFICSDIHNLNNHLINKKFNRFMLSLDLPKSFLGFLNLIKVIKIILKLRIFFKKNKFDILFLHTPLISHFIRISTFGLKLNICYFVHGYRFHTKVKLFYRAFFFLIEYILSFNTKSYIVINSEDMKYTRKYFSKNFLYLNGIGVDLINRRIPNKNITDQFIVGVVAGYKKIKGYDDIIYVANKLKDISNINFSTFGYEDNSKYIQTINKLKLKNIKMNEFVTDIYNEIDKFDILLHLSKREGLSTVTIQSLHRGVPVIGYNTRGVRDLIINTFNGLLINFNDRDKAVSAIKYLYENNALYYSMHKNASKSIDYTFSKENSLNKIFNYLKI